MLSSFCSLVEISFISPIIMLSPIPTLALNGLLMFVLKISSIASLENTSSNEYLFSLSLVSIAILSLSAICSSELMLLLISLRYCSDNFSSSFF